MAETAAAGCRACPLWKTGTQTVFGEGPSNARVMLLGEQPGDREDLEGAPFVGPAGKLLDRALEAAEIDRDQVYVDPGVLVCLGATAARTMLGRQFRVTRQRGQVFSLLDGLEVTATIHPSAVLRARDDEGRSAQMAILVEDLGRVAHLLGGGGRRPSRTS